MRNFNLCKRNKKRFISLILLFLLIISICSGIASASSETGTIMDIDLYLKEDGTLHVKKIIHYFLSDSNSENFMIEDDQNPENINISLNGAYGYVDINNHLREANVWIDFYLDPEKTIPARDKDVAIIMEYDLLQAIKFYNDTAQIQYKLVNYGGYMDFRQINAKIHLKSNKNVEYEVLFSPTITTKVDWNGNNLTINTQNVTFDNYLQLNMGIPRDQFDNDPKYGINEVKLEKIRQNGPIISLLIILLSSIPLFIYLRYGREPKIDYDAEYETDLPTDDSPAIVNALCSRKVGISNLDGFRATILDLIDRNYLLLHDGSLDDVYYAGDLLMEINPDYDPDSLWKFEKMVLDYLEEYEQDGIISMDLVSESLNYYDSADFFKYTYKNWKKEVKRTLLDGDNFKDAFYSKGDKYLKIFGIMGIILLICFFTVLPILFSEIFNIAILILAISTVISLILPQKIAGQWTPYGREYYERWMNFKRYTEDFSLIKEYPPESVRAWDRYLVYATALGAAKGVRKAMQLSIPNYRLE